VNPAWDALWEQRGNETSVLGRFAEGVDDRRVTPHGTSTAPWFSKLEIGVKLR
jgi:hypothetical protein